MTPEDYDDVMSVNTRGAFFVAQEVAKRMIARSKGEAPGTYTGGRIVNVASMAGLRVFPQIGVYCMSKAAVVHMTRAMALEWGRFGINVNALCPGYIDTEINHHVWQTEAGQKMVQAMPRKRIGQPRGPGRGADDAVLQPEPLRQRRGDLGRRRSGGVMDAPEARLRRLPPRGRRQRPGGAGSAAEARRMRERC